MVMHMAMVSVTPTLEYHSDVKSLCLPSKIPTPSMGKVFPLGSFPDTISTTRPVLMNCAMNSLYAAASLSCVAEW